MKILGIETSFDETAAAIVEDGKTILSNFDASSKELHERNGGVIPEIAAREQVKFMIPVLHEALQMTDNRQQITEKLQYVDAFAVTVGPGLNGSLLVGVETAKTLAAVTGKPIIPVNHVLAHVYANFVSNVIARKNDEAIPLEFSSIGRDRHASLAMACEFPAIALVVSGGHTELYLMESVTKLQWLGGTMDDAAGEAFDKTARMLGLGYGGGVALAAEAAKFQISNFKFQISKLPRPMIGDKSFNFSFSGLKTAVMREIKKLKDKQQFNNLAMQQLAYEIQEAITDVLVRKTLKAAKQFEAKSIVLGGGVAANERLKDRFELGIMNYELGISLHVPPVSLCTDNAVMIAAYAYYHNKPVPWQEIQAQPDLNVEIS